MNCLVRASRRLLLRRPLNLLKTPHSLQLGPLASCTKRRLTQSHSFSPPPVVMNTSTFQEAAASCKTLSDLPAGDLKAFLSSFDTVMTDCDGVLWIGDEALDGAVDAVNLFRRLGKKIFYCTNNSTKTRDEYVVKTSKLGFGGDKEEIIGTSYLAANYLKELKYDGKVFVLGSSGVTQELTEVGIEFTGAGEDAMPSNWNLTMADDLLSELGPEYRCVIVGFDRMFNYIKVAKAASLLSRPGTIYIATNTDENFPHKGGANIMLPGTAVMVNAVSTAGGREPIVMGKPSPLMFEQVQKVHPEINPKRTLMIGDRANTDILLGKNCQLQTLMVGSGVHSLANIREWESKAETRRLVADFYADKLGDIVKLAEKAGI